MNAIELCGIRKDYGDKRAVNDLTFSVGEGEFFGLLGVNGAGKTTLIGMLCGFFPPSAGDARILGHSIRTEGKAIKGSYNVSPQQTAVAAKLTVRENLEFIARIYGKSAAEAKEAADRVMQELCMEEVAGQKAGTLSGGWQRRLSIAMALITEPKVLFLDEPTLGLDVLARRELWHVLERLKGRMTIVLTTHYLEEAEALCDRICVLVRGSLCALGTVPELKAQAGKENFEDAFVELATRAEGDHV